MDAVRDEHDGEIILTRAHSYVAEFALHIRTWACLGSVFRARTAPVPSPRAPAAGDRAQTPCRPFLPQATHCKHQYF